MNNAGNINDSGLPIASSNDSLTTATSGSSQVSFSAPNLSSSSLSSGLSSDSMSPYQQQQQHRNGSTRRGLVHSVSIIVEPVGDSNLSDDNDDTSSPSMSTSVSSERRNTIAGPIVLFEDLPFEPPRKAREEDDIVQSIIAHARLRKEEFARLLEEHAQIVNEINRAETSLL